jgi:hypothetical protein
MVLEFCNRGTLSDAIQRGWLLSGMLPNSPELWFLWMTCAHRPAAVISSSQASRLPQASWSASRP